MKLLKLSKRTKISLCIYNAFVYLCNFGIIPVNAAGDPLAVINNLSTFVFAVIRAVGMIILGFGIVQFGMAMKTHDPSQRANSLLTIAGGIIITFAKEILDILIG